ncbi:MAG: carboxypeptidase regulatory-like domain-containing protein [Saprospiraceae bacterium]
MSLRTWAFSALFLGALSTAKAQAPADELRRADKQFNLYAYNLALKSYQAIAAKDPANVHALARIADCYFQLNRPEESLTWYDRATSQSEVKPDVLLRYGQALMATGNYAAAKKWFLFYAEHNREEGRHYADMCEYAFANSQKEALYQAKNEAMNTAAADFGPAFYGKRIVFESSRTDLARSKKGTSTEDWSGSAYNQLFVTQRDANGNLQKPAFLKNDLSNAYNEGPVSYAANGKRVAFCRNNFVDGTRQIAASGINMSLYTADVADGDWVNVKAFPYNGSDYATGFPCLSPDGNTLFFASNRPDGEGGWDIYKCIWNGKSWSSPANLGKQVNSKGNEITPFFDGKNLYFSSDWLPGLGGMDVFRAENVDGNWANVFHLGPGINSPRDDYGFIFNANENIGYLTSNRAQGKGNEDIWSIRKKTDDFFVSIVDAAQKPVPEAVIDFSNCNGGEFTADAAGKYMFSVTAGQANCRATVRKKGFREAVAEFKSTGSKQIEVVLESDASGKFVGNVQDFLTRKPLAEVVVRALPMPKGEVVTAETGNDGQYSLLLEARKTYKLQFSRDGYADTVVTLQTGEAKALNDVQPVLLQDAGALVADSKKPAAGTAAAPAPATYSAPSTAKPAEKEAEKQVTKKGDDAPAMASKESDKPLTTSKEAKTAPQESPIIKMLRDEVAAESKTAVKGWAVQIAALPGNPDSDKIAKYDDLRPLGNIYTQAAGGNTKIRLGVYETREKAEAAMKKAVAMNYRNPFVVEEKAVAESLIFPAKKPAEKMVAKTATTAPSKPVELSQKAAAEPEKPAATAEKTPEKTAAAPSTVRFAVQLAALKNDKTVNLAPFVKAGDVGNLYTSPANDLVKIRVGIWETNEEAEAAQARVVKLGFKDADVVIEKITPETEQYFIKKETAPVRPVESAKPVETPKTTPKGDATPAKPAQYSLETPKSIAPVEAAVPPSVASIYKVRVATYADADNFDAANIADVGGKLERKKSGKLTIFLLGSFPDLESAIRAKNAVRARGYRDAHVVKDESGKLTRMRF